MPRVPSPRAPSSRWRCDVESGVSRIGRSSPLGGRQRIKGLEVDSAVVYIMPLQELGAGVSENRFSYPCRFKKRDDGSYFIRFPDLPEAMVDLVEEADLHRSASKCLASVLYWRITNEIEIPPPSRPRPGQHLIELRRAQAFSEAIARWRLPSSDADLIDAPPDRIDAPIGRGDSRLTSMTPDDGNFGSLAVAAE